MKRMRIDEWFFLGFLLTFSLSIRKVLYFMPVRNAFNEYTGVYLYLSDLFVVATLVSWSIYILKHKSKTKSIANNNKESVNVPRGTNILKKILFKNNSQVIHSFVKYLFVGFVVYILLSITWSNNQNIALYKVIKLTEVGLLFWYLIKNVPRGTFLKRILWITVAIGAMNSLLGILQVILQHSMGLIWLKESYLSANTNGVAKVILGNIKVLRAYALFPHPNIFGGFLLLSIISNLTLLKMFHVEHSSEDKNEADQKCSTWNITSGSLSENVPRGTLLYILLFLQGVALIATFSKSAWAGLIIIILLGITKNVPRGTKSDFYRKAILVGLIAISALLAANYNFKENLIKSVSDRLMYINVSRGTIENNLWLGIGLGQSIIEIKEDSNLENWQFQPVHNVYLLVFQEIGLIGIIVLVCLIILKLKMFHVEHFQKRGNPDYFKALLISYLWIMVVDHYLWDIQQGQFMFVLALAIWTADKQYIVNIAAKEFTLSEKELS